MTITPPGLEGEQLRAVQEWLVHHRKHMLADLDAYVSHETPSNHKPLLDAGLDWITGWLTDRLAGPLTHSRDGGGEYGDVLLAEVPASNGAPSADPVLFLCHYDTVWDAGTLMEWPFRCHDGVATGPGVFDMKAGLVQGVWALRALEQLGIGHPAVRLLLNGDEELGSKGSRPAIEKAAVGVTAALVLEPSADAAVKTSRKGVGIFELEVFGIEAHAGLDPTSGASAIDELARLVLALRRLEDLEVGTSINVGTFHGGSRTNVIPGHAKAMVDVRVTSETEANRIESALRALTPSDPRLRVTLGGGWNRPVMERTQATAALYDIARRIAADLGFDLAEVAAGGGSDGNFLGALGTPVLDGLGPVGAGAHSRSEWVDVRQMPQRAALVAGLVYFLHANVAAVPAAGEPGASQ